MPPANNDKVTKSKAPARKPKTTVPLEKYEMDLFIMWKSYEDQKEYSKADFGAIGKVVGLNRKATSKRVSRIKGSMEKWQEEREKAKTDGGEEQRQAQEEVEADDTQVEEEDTQTDAEDAQAEAQLEKELEQAVEKDLKEEDDE